jgi:hypothetical protein
VEVSSKGEGVKRAEHVSVFRITLTFSHCNLLINSFLKITKHFSTRQHNITMTPSSNNINNSTSTTTTTTTSISENNNHAVADLRMAMREDFNGQKTVNLAQSLRRMKRRLLLEFVEQDMTTIRQSNSFNSDSQSCHSSCSSLSCSVESED